MMEKNQAEAAAALPGSQGPSRHPELWPEEPGAREGLTAQGRVNCDSGLSRPLLGGTAKSRKDFPEACGGMSEQQW